MTYIIFKTLCQTLTEPNDVAKYNVDWLNKYKSKNLNPVLFPESTSEVQQILKYCNLKNIPVVPQSGNTGLVGGSVPIYNEIVISMTKMNKVLGFDPYSSILQCEAGCILDDLNKYISDFNHTIPLDLGARESCMIGGNISTNAGGINYIKYNSMRANVLGLKVVTGNADVIDNLSFVRKRATGFDLTANFIGAEGSLGIVTECSILCKPETTNKALLWLGCNSFSDVCSILQISKESSDILYAIEYIDIEALNINFEFKHLNNPLSCAYNYAIVVQFNSNFDEDLLNKKVLDFYEQSEDYIVDGIISQSLEQSKQLMKYRESVAVWCNDEGYTFKYDVSLPIEYFDEIVSVVKSKLVDKDVRVIGYGHIGDGNLHLNVVCRKPEERQEIEHILEPYVFEYVQERSGSISAEHGMGQQKSKYLNKSKGTLSIEYMQSVKKIMDNNYIMNPYKLLW